MSDTPKSVTQKELSDTLHRLNYQSEIAGYVGKPWSFDDLATALLTQFTILCLEPDGTWDCIIEGPDSCTIPNKGQCTARCVGDEQ